MLLYADFFSKLTFSKKQVSICDQEIITTITHCRPTHCTVRKSQRTMMVTRHQEDKVYRIAISFLFPIKMIAKLERTQSTAQQNMEQMQNPTMGATIHSDRINNNRTILEWTAA